MDGEHGPGDGQEREPAGERGNTLVGETERYLRRVSAPGIRGWFYSRLLRRWKSWEVLAFSGVVSLAVAGGLIALLLVVLAGVGRSHAAAAAPVPAACEDSTNGTLNLVAAGIQFSEHCLVVPPGKPVTIVFHNYDRGIPHNVAVYSPQAVLRNTPALYRGPLIKGPATVTYRIAPLPPGTYDFICQVHPNSMHGVLIVR